MTYLLMYWIITSAWSLSNSLYSCAINKMPLTIDDVATSLLLGWLTVPVALTIAIYLTLTRE